MFVAKVVGSVVATQKIDSMVGQKLMIIEPFRVSAKKRDKMETTGRTLVAVDFLGAGLGEFVLVTQGSSARMSDETRDKPVDAVIIGIVDQIQVEKNCIYSKQD